MFETNEYFDGKVKSIAFTSKEGPATVGVMGIGEYEFGTDSIEIMSVVSGSMDIKLPGSDQWKTFLAGDSFEVAKGVKFGVRIKTETSYLCLYK
jgi:purine/pyrimidine-nucleoside phosphorylase